jgi:hypothetical protein
MIGLGEAQTKVRNTSGYQALSIVKVLVRWSPAGSLTPWRPSL